MYYFVKKIFDYIHRHFCRHDMEIMHVFVDKKSGKYNIAYQCNKCGYILNINN